MLFTLALSLASATVFSATWVPDEFSGKGFQYFDSNDRIQTVQRLCKDLKRTYALWELKKDLIGLDSEAHCASAIATEVMTADPTDRVEQAKGNLAFFDRVQKFAAGFRDTHFGVYTNAARTPVVLPVMVRKIEGKFLVSARSEKFLQFAVVHSILCAYDSTVGAGGV